MIGCVTGEQPGVGKDHRSEKRKRGKEKKSKEIDEGSTVSTDAGTERFDSRNAGVLRRTAIWVVRLATGIHCLWTPSPSSPVHTGSDRSRPEEGGREGKIRT